MGNDTVKSGRTFSIKSPSSGSQFGETSNRRLFDRIEVEATFEVRTDSVKQTYSIEDISVGGFRINKTIPTFVAGEVVNGSLVVRTKNMSVGSRVACSVVGIEEKNSQTRFKFIEISEEFIEFIRAYIVRDKAGSEYSAYWLQKTPAVRDLPSQTRKTLLERIKRVFGLELLALLLVFGLAILIFLRSSNDQSHWLVGSHEIVSLQGGEIASLRSDFPVSVGEAVATVSSASVDGGRQQDQIASSLQGQSITWLYNIGDVVPAGAVLGMLHNAPMSNGKVQAIVSVDSPFYSVSNGEILMFKSNYGERLEGLVVSALTPSQAVKLTGLSFDTIGFSNYHLVEVAASTNTPIETNLNVDHLATALNAWSIKLSGWFGL